MNDPYDVTYQFSVDPKADLNHLRVNLLISNKNTGSEWYGYSKTITVIDGGKVLQHKFKDDDDLYYSIEAYNSQSEQYFEYHNSSEHDALRTDYIRSFIFSDQQVKLGTQIIGNQYEKHFFYEDKFNYTTKPKELKSLTFYNPKTTKYKMSELSDEYIKGITQRTRFSSLKISSKLKEEDILRLTNLTDEQKQELIEIHAKKEFRPAESFLERLF